METTDKPSLMSREEIEQHCTDGTENCTEERFEQLVSMALAAHDIYDKAIEDAAQVCDRRVKRVGPGYVTAKELAKSIRQLKGTSNG